MNRIGYPDQPVIWQGALPHGTVQVGLATSGAQHGRVGCANVATAMALRFLGARAGATVLDVHRAALARAEVVYPVRGNPAAAVIPELVRAQKGLKVIADVAGAGKVASHEAAHDLIVDTLRAGGICLVCVDYDAHLPKGDPTGEHWGCAYAIEDGFVLVADPATARTEKIELSTLRAVVKWGDVERPYHIVRVVAVERG